ncbi:MAG TPA: lectin-like protein, partial [Candidatus Anammoximicrobium sp.]|nr:lectin-like protein [Candidatus Anammoximicrobium sp.]
DLAGGVDLTATNGALNLVTSVAAINLSGATGSTNTIDGNGNAPVTLANITATFSPNLTVNSEGAVTMASANIGTSGSMSIAVDNNDNGTQAGTFGALSAGSLAITGTSGNNDITFNGPGTSNVATSVSVTGAGAIDVNAKITAGTTVVMTASDNITIDAAIDPTTVTLTSDDDVLVNAPVSATTLITVQAGQDGVGSVTVDGTAPETGSLTTTGAAPNSDIDITAGASNGGIALGGNVTAGDRLTLTSNATFANGGGVNQTSGTVSAGNLQLTGTSGAFALTQPANNFGTVAAQTDGGSVNLTDTNSIIVGTVVTSGIDTGSTGNGGAVTINATNGTITVNQAINTSTGTGGGVSISGSVVVNAALTAGAGTITLNGTLNGAFDLDINAPITSDLTINLTAPRDILVGATVQTTGAGADIILTADSETTPDGVGGVRIEAAGQLVSKDAVTLTGSDLFDTTGLIGTPNDSVRVDADGVAVQITAEGAVLLQSGANAPAGADIFINGLVQTTVLGDITVNALDTIQLGANLTANAAAADKIDLQDPVVLTAGVTLTAGSTGINFASTVNGGFDLVLNTSGSTAFNGAVGNSTPVGDGTGAAITINSTGNTRFYGTVQTASGISATDTTATVQFDGNVTIGAGNTASTFNGSVTLDGLTMNAGRDVTFGNAAASDQVTLSGGAVAVNTTANNGNLTFNAKIDGAQSLTLSTNGAGDVDFNGLIGSVNPPSSLTVSASDTTTFDAVAIVAGNVTTTSAGLTAVNFNLTSNTGNIDLRSTGGNISQANGTTVLATAGGVRMRTDTGNVTVFNVTAGANNFPNHVPTANTAAIKMDVAGNFTQNGVLTATSAADLNIDIDPVDEFIHGDETATGYIYHSASNNITVDTNAKLEADSDNSGGGTLQMIADNDATGGGDLLATDGTQLIGAVVSLSGYNVTVDVVQGKTGNVTITGANNVTLNDNVSAGPATGNVDVQATAGTLHQTGANILAGGFVELDAGTLVNLDGTTGAVTPIGGDVRINTNLAGAVQIDGNVTANGAVTIGRSDFTGGAVTIGSAVACTITSDANSSGAEDVTIRAGAAISQAAGTIDASTGGVFIRSAASTVSVVDVNSAGVNQLNPAIASDNNASPAAAIQIRAFGTATVVGVDATGTGAIVEVVSDTASIQLHDVDATTSVFLQANSGAIVDANGGANNITAANAAFRAATGIGSGDYLETDVDVLVASNSTSGNIEIRNVDANASATDGLLIIGTVGTLAGITNADPTPSGGTIWITNIGPVTVANAVTDSAAGDITITAEGNDAEDDLTVNAHVTASGGNGNISLYAGDSISLAGTVTVGAAGTGAVLLSAGSDYNNNSPIRDGNSGGDVSMASGSVARSEDGDITVLAPDNVQLSIVNANSDGDAVLGDVIVTADYAGPGVGAGDTYASDKAGAISDNLLSGEGPNLVGDQAALRAGTGIGDGGAGAATDIDLAVNTLAAVTGSGDINVEDVEWLTIATFNGLSGLTITNADGTATGNDDISVVTGGDLTVAAGNPIANDDGGDVTLSAEGGGHYQRIAGPFSFGGAQGDAAARGGYLATIRSAVENAKVQALLLPGLNEAWIGASDAATEGTWLWVNGPESGIQFWSGNQSGSAVGGEYSNWNSPEPNDAGNEDFGVLVFTGRWNDMSATDTRDFYILELPLADLTVNASVTITGGAGAVTLRANNDVLGDEFGDLTTADGHVVITADLDNSTFTGTNANGTIRMEG